jgi:hypothetical protein
VEYWFLIASWTFGILVIGGLALIAWDYVLSPLQGLLGA